MGLEILGPGFRVLGSGFLDPAWIPGSWVLFAGSQGSGSWDLGSWGPGSRDLILDYALIYFTEIAAVIFV